jgi:hypothetical protein
VTRRKRLPHARIGTLSAKWPTLDTESSCPYGEYHCAGAVERVAAAMRHRSSRDRLISKRTNCARSSRLSRSIFISTQLKEFDVAGILAFAERVLPKASEPWGFPGWLAHRHLRRRLLGTVASSRAASRRIRIAALWHCTVGKPSEVQRSRYAAIPDRDAALANPALVTRDIPGRAANCRYKDPTSSERCAERLPLH